MSDEIHEQVLRIQIAYCEKEVSDIIAMSLKWQRRRLWWCVSNAVVQLLSASYSFYHFHYLSGIFSCVLAEVLTCLTWWSFTRNVKVCRQFRREWGQLKRNGERLLKELGYAE